MGDLASALLFSLAILRIPWTAPDLDPPRCRAEPPDVPYLLHDMERRVRALTPRLAVATEAGARRSPTFLHLLRTLQVNDVIVQMLDEPNMRRPLGAKLTIVPVPGTTRFVRVHVGREHGGDELVALLGHELVHALEVAAESQVRDAETLEALYRRIGFGVGRPRQYDSHAANDIERQIRRELQENVGCSPPSNP